MYVTIISILNKLDVLDSHDVAPSPDRVRSVSSVVFISRRYLSAACRAPTLAEAANGTTPYSYIIY